MTEQQHSGTLEDCYTNVFCIAELNGLKWTCLTSQPPTHLIHLDDDLVLNSYAECMKNDLLCTWRRRPPPLSLQSATNDLTDNFNMQKELWIFWYQKEPKIIESFKSNGLSVPEERMIAEQTVDYEIRVILFKALHNVLERRYFKEGYIRLGNWFTKPFSLPLVKQTRLPKFTSAVTFEFFLHRDNFVCMIMKAQRQPSLLKLSENDLKNTKPLPVILGPWSFKAHLLSNQENLKDCNTPEMKYSLEKEWNEWIRYIMPESQKSKEKSSKPRMVLVELSNGIQMFYPISYVCILVEESDGFVQDNSSLSHQGTSYTTKVAEDSSLSTGADLNRTNLTSKFMDYLKPDDCCCSLCNNGFNCVFNNSISLIDDRCFHKNRSRVQLSLNAKFPLRPSGALAENDKAIFSEIRYDWSANKHLNSPAPDPFILTIDHQKTKLHDIKSRQKSGEFRRHLFPPKSNDSLITNNDENTTAESELQCILNAGICSAESDQNIHFTDQLDPYLCQRSIPVDSNPSSSEDTVIRTSNTEYHNNLVIKKRIIRRVRAVKKRVNWPWLPNYDEEFTSDLSKNKVICSQSEHQCFDVSKSHELDESVQTDENMTAVTPPALLNGNVGYRTDILDSEQSIGSDFLHSFESVSGSAQLSPPASNEQVDYSGQQALISHNFLNTGGTINQIDSLSYIYPTPPTPAPFQFSPQMPTTSNENDVSSVLKERQTETSDSLLFTDIRHITSYNSKFLNRFYDDAEICLLPQSGAFKGTIDDIMSPEGRTKFCMNCKSTKNLEFALEKRSRRHALSDKPRCYKFLSTVDLRPITRQKCHVNMKPSCSFIGRISETVRRNNSQLASCSILSTPMEHQSFENRASNVNGCYSSSAILQRPGHIHRSYNISDDYLPCDNTSRDNCSTALSTVNLDVGMPQSGLRPLSNCSTISHVSTSSHNRVQSSISGLLVTLIQDTIANIHFDPVFDTCPICSCNSNIRSFELGLYINAPKEIIRRTDLMQQRADIDFNSIAYNLSGFKVASDELQKCKCGFSSIRHRYLCDLNTGLFPEDISEAVGPLQSLSVKRACKMSSFSSMLKDIIFKERMLLNLVLQQCSYLDMRKFCLNTSKIFNNINASKNYKISLLYATELDGIINSIIQKASPIQKGKESLIHEWGYQIANLVDEPSEAEYSALFDEFKKIPSIERKPEQLTIRSLSRKHPKMTQDDEKNIYLVSVPNVMAVSSNDIVLIPPTTIRLWDKLELSPYDQPKNILYLTIIPDNEIIAEKTKNFMDDFSSTYEKRCKFGAHTRVGLKDAFRDGLIRVGFKTEGIGKYDNDSMHKFFSDFGDFGKEKAKMDNLLTYSDNCFQELQKFFNTFKSVFDKRAFYESVSRNRQRPLVISEAIVSSQFTHMQSPNSTLSSTSGPSSNVVYTGIGSHFAQHSPTNISNLQQPPSLSLDEINKTPQNQAEQLAYQKEMEIEKEVEEMLGRDRAQLPHMIVIYLVNPFNFGSKSENDQFSRLAIISLLRAYSLILQSISHDKRPQLQFELLDLHTIFDSSSCISISNHTENQCTRDRLSRNDYLCQMAFSVYSKARHLTPNHIKGSLTKSMTRFGPAASLADIFKAVESASHNFPFKKYCAPFVLSPKCLKSLPTNDNTLLFDNKNERVLFVSYCLIDEDWICVGAVDENGSFLDSNLINISIPESRFNAQWKHKHRHSQIYDAIFRLWLYIQSIMLLGFKNWRLIIGRVGKIGHGEFKAWTEILSKTNLRSYNNNLKSLQKDMNSPCRPCSHSHGFQDMPVILSASLISTEPELYMRVFPSLTPLDSSQNSSNLSAKNSKGSSKQPPQNMLISPEDTSVTHIMVFPTILYLQHGEGEDQDAEELDEFFRDLRNTDNALKNEDLDILDLDLEVPKNEEESNINNQPMATGYSISTAPLVFDMPESFWSACPNLKRHFPVNLKSSLHIHSTNIQAADDYPINAKTESHHPLDTLSTDDVLRYVLEAHNALSWLNIDFSTGSRQSCLPLHVQVLLKLYNSITTLFS